MQKLAPAEVLAQFGLDGATVSGNQTGRIHDTSIATGVQGKWILQRINTDVFEHPTKLMENAMLTRTCVAAAGGTGLEYRRSVSGSLLVHADDGSVWRSYRYVEGQIIRRPSNNEEVDRLARAFGEFDAALELHEPSDWHLVLPRFHDHRRRVADLHTAVRLDPLGRAVPAAGDLDSLEDVIGALEHVDEFAAWGESPIRAVHHDAKSVNLVSDGDSARATILDLDTVMAGTILSDVGELVRSCGRGVAGDPDGFEVGRAQQAIVSFLAGWNRTLSDPERAALPVAGLMMTVQNASRFMADHMLGDQYYTHEPGRFPNLARARALTQFARAQLDRLDDLRQGVSTV